MTHILLSTMQRQSLPGSGTKSYCTDSFFRLTLKKARCTALVIAAWVMLFAPSLAYGAEQVPAYGDTLVFGMLGEPTNLIPPLSSDNLSSAVSDNFYVGLLKYDKNLNVVPHAAKSFTIHDDGRRFHFVLRKGITWEDGVELTADDIEFTYRLMIDPATPTAYAGDWKMIKEFRKLDRYTIEVLYENPFPRAVNTWMSDILPKHALENQDLRGTPLARKPISCGPYLLHEWKSGSSLTLTANPGYFLGKPYIDRVLYRVIPDVTTMFLELKAGKLDIMESLTALQYLFQTNDRSFTDNFSTYSFPDWTYTYLGYNLKSPLFSDVRVRQAFAYAIDKEEIIQIALLGQGVPTIGPYTPSSWAYNKAIKPFPHDPQKALKLLADAGWTKGKSGWLEKDGKPFSFTILTNQGNEQRINCAVLLQSQLRRIGIEVKIRTVEMAAFITQFVMPGNFDAIVLAWSTPLDPDTYDVWHSSRIGGLNFIGYSNKEVDDCLERARTTLDQAVRKKEYDRFQEILHREQPYCFLYVPYKLSAVQKRFRGLEPAPAGITYNSKEWWVPLQEQRYRTQIQ